MTRKPPEGAVVRHPYDAFEIVTAGRRCAVELEASRRAAQVDPVQEARVEMDVQVQARTESLNEGHRTRSRSVAVPDPRAPRPASVPVADRVHENSRERTQDLRVERRERTELERKREHPLTQGDRWQDAIDKRRGLVRHPSAGATRAHAPMLAREGNEEIVTAGVAARANEPVGEVPAPQVLAEFGFDVFGNGAP